MEAMWLTQAKKLQSIASTGLHFSKDAFDRERYAAVAEIANSMLAEIGSVPIDRIVGLVSDFAQGYATPKVDVRGAVIDGDTVLLVREQADGLWSLPGGFADVGLSAAQNVEKEIREEAGLSVTACQLYGVRHKAKQDYEPDARDFYKMFFLCSQDGGEVPTAGVETTEARFFRRHSLPPLCRDRVLPQDIECAFAYAEGSRQHAFFD